MVIFAEEMPNPVVPTLHHAAARDFDHALTPGFNAEDFSLRDFLRLGGSTLDARVRPFSAFIAALRADGHALYGRELESATGARVSVRDPLSAKTRPMVMMGSNNYLGLANHPAVRAAAKDAIDTWGAGVGGPPLLNGMTALHRRLEQEIARLKGQEDALLFASGFQANLGWVTALLHEGDVLVVDELHHASVFDGIKLARAGSRFAVRFFRHNDVEHLEKQLVAAQAARGPDGQVFVAVEGVYSMDGDVAPLNDIGALSVRHEATLVVDDAHGTGVLGAHGAGTAAHLGAERFVQLAMGTFSKSFGVTGGFLAGKREVIDYLRFFARSYMFSAHLPPPTVAAVLAGIDVLRTDPSLQARLHANVAKMVRGLRALGLDVATESAIVPIRLPERVDARALGRRLHEFGLFTNIIEYPAVARNAQRVRLSISAEHTDVDVAFALRAIETAGAEVGLLVS